MSGIPEHGASDVSATQVGQGQVTSHSEPSHAELLKRAEEFARLARERAPETEAAGSVLPELVQAMYDADLIRIMQPRHWGGYERSWSDFFELAHVIAQGCPSTGWVYNVLASHPPMVGNFPLEAQTEVWGEDPDVLISSAFAPTGQGEVVDGGYRLSGRFPFSSGSEHAQWAMVGAIAPGADGIPGPQIFLVPMSELTKIDDWDVIGLRATRSQSLACEDLFVPAHRVLGMAESGLAMPYLGVQAAVTGAALGGVQAFIDDIREKPGKFGGPPPSQSEHIQVEAAKAWAEANAAWELLRGGVLEADQVAKLDTPPHDLRLRSRAKAVVITSLSVSAIGRVHALTGGSGIRNNAVSRAFRDVNAGAKHIVTDPYTAAREVGATLLTSEVGQARP